MIYRVGLNDIEHDHWCAWVFDLHGCFAKGRTRGETIALVPQAIQKYGVWRSRHNHSYQLPDAAFDFEVVEDIRSWWSGDYFANAFFMDDRRSLTSEDVDTVRQLLAYTRGDLHEVIESLSSRELDAPISGEVWGSLRGVLNHIATAEW